jgi:hypothetical protein
LKNELEYEEDERAVKDQENFDDVFLTEAPNSVRGDFT